MYRDIYQILQGGESPAVRVAAALSAVADRPAGDAVLAALRPPAVEDRRVEHAAPRRLHPGGARRLERAARIVEPHPRAPGRGGGDRAVRALREDARPR